MEDTGLNRNDSPHRPALLEQLADHQQNGGGGEPPKNWVAHAMDHIDSLSEGIGRAERIGRLAEASGDSAEVSHWPKHQRPSVPGGAIGMNAGGVSHMLMKTPDSSMNDTQAEVIDL